MRISDWSSDVCSSDLIIDRIGIHINAARHLIGAIERRRLQPVDQTLAVDAYTGLIRRHIEIIIAKPAPRRDQAERVEEVVEFLLGHISQEIGAAIAFEMPIVL